MKKSYIFGTGSTARRVYNLIKQDHEVIGFLDNDQSKWGSMIDGIPVIAFTERLLETEYDEILVCSLPAMETIKQQLIDAGVPCNFINTEYVSTQTQARINFLRDYANIWQKENACVAEGGVYQGDFAKEINECFPDSPLYLFDTFEGFDQRDLSKEHAENYSEMQAKHIGNTSVELVIGKLPHQGNAIIRKGYFPETARGLEDKRFCFVNLDFDLYNPTIEGLRFFYPRMLENGVILVHDYYNEGYKGVKQAVEEYAGEVGTAIKLFPIGDHCSIGIMK